MKVKTFNPKEDITTFELVKVVEQFMLAMMQSHPDEDIQLPEEYVTSDIARHFD